MADFFASMLTAAKDSRTDLPAGEVAYAFAFASHINSASEGKNMLPRTVAW